MGLFTAYVDQMPTVATTLGATLRIPMTRDFPREGFAVRVEGEVTTAAGTGSTTFGLLTILKRVRLVVNDGSTTRSIVDADGISILQRHVHYNQSLDRNTVLQLCNKNMTEVDTFSITYPHFFAPGVINSPTRDLFLQNFPRFNTDPYLEIQLSTSEEIDFTADDIIIANITVTILDFKRVVNIPNWNFLNVAFETFQRDYPTDAPNQRYPIPIPGYHFAIGIRPYIITGKTTGDISRDFGLIKIQALNQVERSLSFSSLQIINDWSDDPLGYGAEQISTDPVSLVDPTKMVQNSQAIVESSAWFDYLTDQTGSDVVNLDTLFNTNAFVNIGAVPEIVWDVQGGVNKSVVYMHDRCFGDITGALALLQNSRKK